MNRKISDQQIEFEVQSVYRPPAIDSGITILPLNSLGDREFELLCYLLVKSEIESGEIQGISNIALMQGVGERGRDCILYSHDTICGLIQCKKYTGRVSRPQVIKEIVKFLLYSIDDKSLLPNPQKFEYKLYVSNDLTGPAIVLINSFAKEIQSEISSGKINKYIEDIVEEYESLSKFRENPPFDDVVNLIQVISVSSSNAIDLSERIYRKNHILKMFFNIKSVVSVEEADNVLRKALDDYGLRYLTDEDLKSLKSRIENTSQYQRINLGIVDFYGFDRRFFRYLKKDDLKRLLTKATEIKTFLDLRLMEFIQEEINKRIFTEITLKLLYSGKIHQFSVGLAAPYLFNRLSRLIISQNLPEELSRKIFGNLFLSKEELIKEISHTLLAHSEQIMQGDYSDIVGDEELVSFKLRIFEHIHQGFANISEVRDRLSRDTEVLIPVLDKIESELLELLSETRTIIIKDGEFLENPAELKRILDSANDIDIPNA